MEWLGYELPSGKKIFGRTLAELRHRVKLARAGRTILGAQPRGRWTVDTVKTASLRARMLNWFDDVTVIDCGSLRRASPEEQAARCSH